MNLSEQVGPLPLGVWVLAGAAGVGIAVYSRRSSSRIPAPTSSAGSPITDQSGGVGIGPGGWALQPPVPVPVTPVSTKPTSNQQWYQAAFSDMIAKGYDAALVDQALKSYINGFNLSASQWVIVRLALVAIGPLPEAINPNPNDPPGTPIIAPPPPPPTQAPGPINIPPPPPSPAPPPRDTSRRFTVTPWPSAGSTLWGIAGIMYGDHNKWPQIYNANRNQIHNPNLIYIGQVLVIP